MSKYSKFLVCLLFSILCTPAVFSQSDANIKANEVTIIAETTDGNIAENEFKSLISANAIVYQLRKNYGIKGSVLLSKALWQILNSYNNQQQAQNVWQAAINKIPEIDHNRYSPLVNFQFISGQILSKYTNGMTLEKWHESRIGIKINKNNIDDFLRLNDELTIYMQLNSVWDVILTDIARQENIIWSDVFVASFTIFSDAENSHDNVIVDDVLEINANVIEELLKWQNTDDKIDTLADLTKYIESSNQSARNFYHSIIRFGLNKHYQHYLATSLSWFEVAYYLSVHKVNMTATELLLVNDFIEENDTWFLSKEQQLLAINTKLPQMVEDSINNVKNYYQLKQHPLNLDLPIAYQLIEPHFKKYMLNPFRQKVHRELEVCLNISEEFAPFPQQPIEVNQFNGCIKNMVAAALVENNTRELSGSLTKIDTKGALDRALQLPAWQIINIMYAKIAQSRCLKAPNQLTNPLEWMLAAESLLWFADRWPNYIKKYPHNKQLNRVIVQGQKLADGFNCLEKPKAEILDANFNQIVQAWDNVKTMIKQVADEFVEQNLMPGSDIDLLANAEKPSNYRVKDEKINACDVQKSCGVHVSLESSRALFGLFPNHLLVAAQLKLGNLKLCYDNVGWENKRSAATHLDNDSVANYFANFSFSIKGYYNEDLVFERKLTSKGEYHYLFAENSTEVLSTYCPLSIVGNKISTKLARGTFGLLPNRLTFLTASRANASKILSSHWSAGEEWQDKITSQDTTVVSENTLAELNSDIQQAYQQKATMLQDLIYKTLLNKLRNSTQKQQLLADSFANMSRMTKQFSHLLYLMQMDDLLNNDQLQGIIFGSDKIPDINTIRELHKNQLNINQLIISVDENMQINQNKWNNFTSTWSNAYLNNILFRLSSL